MELCVPAVLIQRGGQADLSLTQLSHPAAPGCLPVTQSSRISPESPSSPSPGDAAPWAPLWSPDSLGAPQAWPLMVRLRAFGLYGGGGLTF